jgi:hypothetical protein
MKIAIKLENRTSHSIYKTIMEISNKERTDLQHMYLRLIFFTLGDVLLDYMCEKNAFYYLSDSFVKSFPYEGSR